MHIRVISSLLALWTCTAIAAPAPFVANGKSSIQLAKRAELYGAIDGASLIPGDQETAEKTKKRADEELYVPNKYIETSQTSEEK
ncbi:hypothetical protein MMC14_007788 [Varicellaria rhodocarpa]|nr:hypothetical protein [Varicellaria rhodocarpa]